MTNVDDPPPRVPLVKQTAEVGRLSYETVVAATDNFSREIGEGSYGKEYHGVLNSKQRSGCQTQQHSIFWIASCYLLQNIGASCCILENVLFGINNLHLTGKGGFRLPWTEQEGSSIYTKAAIQQHSS
ncbi:unnamed protein product [Calypogeia fissa]